MTAGVPRQASLLGLPAELRNEIYDCVAAQPGKIIIREQKIVPPALARACRQIRSEFLPLFQACSGCRPTEIKFFVKNFDFCGLTDQLKGFSLPIRTPRGPRISLTVVLEVDENAMTISRAKALSDWRGFYRHARGSLPLVYKYEVRVACDVLGSWKSDEVGWMLELLRNPGNESYTRFIRSSSLAERRLEAWLENKGVLRDC